jgi:hypothetical protein
VYWQLFDQHVPRRTIGAELASMISTRPGSCRHRLPGEEPPPRTAPPARQGIQLHMHFGVSRAISRAGLPWTERPIRRCLRPSRSRARATSSRSCPGSGRTDSPRGSFTPARRRSASACCAWPRGRRRRRHRPSRSAGSSLAASFGPPPQPRGTRRRSRPRMASSPPCSPSCPPCPAAPGSARPGSPPRGAPSRRPAALRTCSDTDEFLRRHGGDPKLGRLYFHLAEQPDDARHPVRAARHPRRGRGAHGRVQHVPLATAWAEHADEPALRQRLLAPLHRAAERSPGIRALVDSGEVFHPVAWTAAQAHALLRAPPTSGLRHPRPRAGLVAESDRRARRSASSSAPTSRPSSASARCSTSSCATSSATTSSPPTSGAPSWAAPPACTACAAAGSSSTRRATPRPCATGRPHRGRRRRGHIGFAEGMRLLAGSRAARCPSSPAAEWTVAPRPVARAHARRPAEPERQPRGRPRPGPARRAAPLPARRRRPGCGCSSASASAAASPTTWASARPSR